MNKKQVNILEMFEKMVVGMIDEEGIYPQQGMVKLLNDEFECLALALSSNEVLQTMRVKSRSAKVTEMIFGLDTYMLAGQGTEYKDALIIFHAVRGQKVKIGVLEYDWNGGDVKTKPINWENQYWKERYKDVAKSLELPPLVVM